MTTKDVLALALEALEEVFVIGDRLVDDVYGYEFVDKAKTAITAIKQAQEPLTDEQIAESILAADRAHWLSNNFDGTQEHVNEALEKLRAYAKLIRDLLAAHNIGGQP